MAARPRPHYGTTYNRRLLGYSKVHFSKHVLQRMKQRRISREDVYHAIEDPDETGLPTQRRGRYRVRWRKTEKQGIDAVYSLHKETDSVQIITVIRITLKETGQPKPRVRSKQRKPQRRKRRR